jgi:hypothetical protein
MGCIPRLGNGTGGRHEHYSDWGAPAEWGQRVL